MCDFSLYSVRSRPAQVGDKLVTHNFGTGTRGFAAVDDPKLAVCLMPGTELAFASEVPSCRMAFSGGRRRQSTTGRQSFGKSTREREPHITMRSNSRMADRVADDPVPGSSGNSASVACAANDHGRSRCPEAHRLRGLTIRDRINLCRLPYAAYFFHARPPNNQTPDRIRETAARRK